MAVTKQTYTAAGTWTASQLAGIFKDAFVDAGLMTDWFDSFLSGTVENRVLEIDYDATKTYGKVYYWFMFTTTGAFVHTALSWNAGSDIPSGTLYLDYFSTTTNATSNHATLLGSLAAATTVTITRYTSAVDADCSWFLIRNGTTNRAFMIPSVGYGPSAFVDLNRVAFNGLIALLAGNSSNMSLLYVAHVAGHTRRTYLGATTLRGTTAGFNTIPYLNSYLASGNQNNSVFSNYASSTSLVGTWLPTAHVNTNSSLAADHIPIFTGPTMSPYMAPLPSDFGISAYYASNLMAVQDTLVVASGTEEWEMLTVVNNSGNADAGKLLFLARTT